MDVNIWDVGQCIGFESVKMGRQKNVREAPIFPSLLDISVEIMRISRKKIVFFWGGRVWRGERGPQQQQRLGEDAIWGVKGLEWSKKKRKKWNISLEIFSVFVQIFLCVRAKYATRGIHYPTRQCSPPTLLSYVRESQMKMEAGRSTTVSHKGGRKRFSMADPPKKKKMFLPPPGSSSQKIFLCNEKGSLEKSFDGGNFYFFFRSKKWNNTTDSLGIRWNFLGRKIGFWRPTKKNPSGPTEFHWKLKWHFLEKNLIEVIKLRNFSHFFKKFISLKIKINYLKNPIKWN